MLLNILQYTGEPSASFFIIEVQLIYSVVFVSDEQRGFIWGNLERFSSGKWTIMKEVVLGVCKVTSTALPLEVC